LSTGAHDNSTLALALWPERVIDWAMMDPTRFAVLGVKVPKARTDAELVTKLKDLYSPRLTESELRILGDFCDHPGDRGLWQRRWEDFAAGGYDDCGLARAVYPARVVAKAQADPDFAASHDLFRWFWLATNSAARRLVEPPDEISGAVRERTSAAVKAALKNLLEIPVAAAGGGGGRGPRAAVAAAGGGTR
jgi:hypothetical protein